MLHVEVVGQLLAVAHKVADVLSSLAHIVGCLVFVAGIVEGTVFEHVVLKVGRIELADEGAVHIEGDDAVFGADEVGRFGIGHVFDIFLQDGQSLAFVPVGEELPLQRCRGRCRGGHDDGVVGLVTRRECGCAAEDGKDGGEHPESGLSHILFHNLYI